MEETLFCREGWYIVRYVPRKDGSYVEIEVVRYVRRYEGRAVATLTIEEFVALVDKLTAFCAAVLRVERDIGWLVHDDCSDCGIDDSGGLVLRNLVEDEEV